MNNNSLSVLQINIWQGRLLREVVKLINKIDADIVCMQEVYSFDQHQGLVDTFSSLEVILEQTNYTENYYSPTTSLQVADAKMFYGNAILSKFKFQKKETIFTNGKFNHVDSWENHLHNTRNAQMVQIELNGKKIAVINHHGFHDTNPMGNENSAESMQTLADKLKTIDSHIILCGDLNVVPSSNVMRLFDGWLEDLTATNNVEDTLSRFGKVSGVPCDHILVSKEVGVDKFQVLEDLVSDHLALYGEFSF